MVLRVGEHARPYWASRYNGLAVDGAIDGEPRQGRRADVQDDALIGRDRYGVTRSRHDTVGPAGGRGPVLGNQGEGKEARKNKEDGKPPVGLGYGLHAVAVLGLLQLGSFFGDKAKGKWGIGASFLTGGGR